MSSTERCMDNTMSAEEQDSELVAEIGDLIGLMVNQARAIAPAPGLSHHDRSEILHNYSESIESLIKAQAILGFGPGSCSVSQQI